MAYDKRYTSLSLRTYAPLWVLLQVGVMPLENKHYTTAEQVTSTPPSETRTLLSGFGAAQTTSTPYTCGPPVDLAT